MIERIFLNLALIGSIAIVICHGDELNSNETEAKMFLKRTSRKLFDIYDAVRLHENPDFNYKFRKVAAVNEEKSLKAIVRNSREFDFEKFNDQRLKYAFQVLVQVADLKIIKRKLFIELFDSLNEELRFLLIEGNIKDFHDSNNSLLILTDVKKVIRTSHDLKELEYYWSEMRVITGDWAAHNLDIILKALKSAADSYKMSPLEFWLRGFNITDMEKLMTKIQPLYLQLHAFIRNLLQKKYGESIIGTDGLIPDHLLEQVLQQAWTNESIIEEMFPYGSLPPVESVMREKFKTQQLYEIAEGFYENLGFEEYPSSIWGDRIRAKYVPFNFDGEGDKSDEDYENIDDYGCQPLVSYSTPNIGLEFCDKLNFRDFLDAYAIMGYLHYAKEMVRLPAYFFKTSHGLEHAIGKAMVLSASTHHNLKAIGMIPDFMITPKVELNRLLRTAIVRLINIPLDFVQVKVMADLVSGNVTMAELNNHYWNLMDKYAGVGPPKDLKSSDLQLPYNFYERMTQNDMSRDFTTEILSYQIHKKLCELSGKYPKKRLYLCDINGSKEAGNALKKMMKLGISKPFNEVLATIFPRNPTVRTVGIFRYYNPIKKLLLEKNKEANVSPGWKNSNTN